MPVPAGAKKFSYTYIDDREVNWLLVLSVGTASAAGFTAGQPAYPPWGSQHGRNKVRGLHGVSEDGTQKAFLPCPNPIQYTGLFANGSWTNEGSGTTYFVTGRRGEKVSVNRLGA